MKMGLSELWKSACSNRRGIIPLNGLGAKRPGREVVCTLFCSACMTDEQEAEDPGW